MICHQGTTHLTHQAFPKNQITLSFHLTGFKFKIAAENKCWMHNVEKTHGIFDDPELQLIVRVKAKTLCENLNAPMWHLNDGWWHEVIYQIYFWVD